MSRWRKVKQGKGAAPTRDRRPTTPKTDTAPLCAPVGLRLKAFLTDTFMIVMPILYGVIYLVMGDREGFREHMGQGWLIIAALHFTAVFAFWFIAAQTPGMRAYDLYLVDGQSQKKPGILKLLLRYVTMQAGILSFFALPLPWLTQSRRTLWDMISGTCIVHRPR